MPHLLPTVLLFTLTIGCAIRKDPSNLKDHSASASVRVEFLKIDVHDKV
jgi:hypothetical protein